MNTNPAGSLPVAPNPLPNLHPENDNADLQPATEMPAMHSAPRDSASLSAPTDLDAGLSSSAPTLSASGPVRQPSAATPEALKQAILSGDTKEIHRLLDAGVSPGQILGRASLLVLAIAHVVDELTLDRLLEVAGADQRKVNGLYQMACERHNVTALKCLLKWRVPGSSHVAEKLPEMLEDAVWRRDAKDLDALFLLRSEHFSEVKFKKSELFATFCRSIDIPDPDFNMSILKILTKKIGPREKSVWEKITDLFIKAVDAGHEAFAAHMVRWMKNGGEEGYLEPFDWPFINDLATLPEEKVLMLARIGYPIDENYTGFIPDSDRYAAQLQDVLFGSDLQYSQVGKCIAHQGLSLRLINDLCSSALSDARGREVKRKRLCVTLYWAGFRKPLAEALAVAIEGANRAFLQTKEFLPAKALMLCAMINDHASDSSLTDSADPIVRQQALMLREMADNELQALPGGGPVAFFSMLLNCIGLVTVEDAKLLAVVRQQMGLPPVLVAQIRKVLAASHKKARAMPPEISFGPGMTSADILAAVNSTVDYKTIVACAQALPAALGSHEALRQTRETKGDDETLHVLDVSQYAISSVLRAYCQQILEDKTLDEELRRVLAARSYSGEDLPELEQPELFTVPAGDVRSSPPDTSSEDDSDSEPIEDL